MIGTLLILAVAVAPVLVVVLVGHFITTARDDDRSGSRVGDWTAVSAAGVRGTGLLVGAALPVAAALAGSGLLEIEAGSIALGGPPGPILGVAIGALGVATWHVAAVGVAAVTAGSGWSAARGVRFGRSAAGVRLSSALAGLTGGVGIVGFGLTAIPVVGSVAAAGVGAIGVAVGGRLVSRAIARSDRQNGSIGAEASEERLAVPTDGTAALHRAHLDGQRGRHDPGEGSGRV
ncbi:hypothetical protein GCM10008995_06760 [Halobellus salinus]|uniref:Uncharacterized protein n=1 Tax=Halobellus salinus TaxID=931585 RepID=A0A830E866_9EURY|nr:hypothetical protein GCM10008995_06760 [Halobellus salinus]